VGLGEAGIGRWWGRLKGVKGERVGTRKGVERKRAGPTGRVDWLVYI